MVKMRRNGLFVLIVKQSSKTKNILVTGANGQLGGELRRLAPSTPWRFVFTDVTEIKGRETVYLDITNPRAVDIICESEDIDVIINAAGYTNVDKAEDDPTTADLLNHLAPQYLAETARRRGALLVHVSTDYVYGGDSSVPYPEDYPPAPAGVYGATKLQGDQAVTGSACRHYIFRTSWLYSPYGRNFVKTMRQLTQDRDSLAVVFDQVGTPTYAADLAGTILKAVGSDAPSGIYHYSDEGVCSWYDFACAIRDLSGNDCEIRPCHSDEFPSKVRRPHYSVLDKTKVKKTFGIAIPHWYESLKKCIDRL